MKEKTALQITMHFVENYGSVLQAYALQKAVERMPGWRCLTLDFRPHLTAKEPVSEVASDAQAPEVRNKFVGKLMTLLRRGPAALVYKARSYYERYVVQPRLRRVFPEFLTRELHLTPRYGDREELGQSPPAGDVYITGSDQTFNPGFTEADDYWFWGFLGETQLVHARKIAYAASFAVSNISSNYSDAYLRWLPTYHGLSFRESSGVRIAKGMGFESCHCCDPTLLLTRGEWESFSGATACPVRGKYILCYNLTYMVDPYPMARALEEDVGRRLGMRLVYLHNSRLYVNGRDTYSARVVTVKEFVSLFLNASFIMTSSFHGTAFALQSGHPFVSYVNESRVSDSRVADLLKICRAEGHMVPVNQKTRTLGDLGSYAATDDERAALGEFRDRSFEWLRAQMEKAVRR